MFRLNLMRLIGVESDIAFRSVSKDRHFLNARVAQVGSHASVLPPAAAKLAAAAANVGRDKAIDSAEDDDHHHHHHDAAADPNGVEVDANGNAVSKATADRTDTFSRRLTQQELNRFTTSLGSKENLHNHKAGTTPSLVVDEHGRVEGQSYPEPTRYGDWEYNGRCYDF